MIYAVVLTSLFIFSFWLGWKSAEKEENKCINKSECLKKGGHWSESPDGGFYRECNGKKCYYKIK
jgi:hypothetical protein